MIQYDIFQKALKHLELQYESYKVKDTELPELMQEAVAESVIRRFKTCYDFMWKVLKRYLLEGLGIPEVPNSPKPIFRMANENNLFVSSLEQWLRYANARIETSDDYSGEKSEDALLLMSDFIDDAIGLYQTMSGNTWE